MCHTEWSYNMHPIGISIDVVKLECAIKPYVVEFPFTKYWLLQALPICLSEVYCIILAINLYLCLLQSHRNAISIK